MSEYSGPLPVPTPETRPFWEAARRHELSLQRCRACGAHVFYPRAACPRCLGPDLEWRRVSGRGRLHTFTVVHRGARSFPLPAPYALADAGLAKDQVDAVFSAGLWMGSETAEYLGIRPRYIDGTQIGGCSFIAHVGHAMAAIAAGLCEVALITHGESGASRIGMPGTRFGPDSWRLQFEQPFGLAGPPTGYALAAARHMHEFGTTSEQLAEVAVATRRWAQLNPRALRRDPLTVEDVLASRLISWPLHLLDCCLVTDAGGAVVVTSAERARDCPKRAVYVLGAGEASTHVLVSQMPDFARWDAARIAGERAFAMAGVA